MINSWKGNAGDAFFCLSGNKEHLFVVLFDPATYPDEGYGQRLCLVSVNFSSIKDGQLFDTACIVEPGEHPFIRQRSYIVYQRIQFVDYSRTLQCIEQNIYRAAEPVSPELLKRIRQGIALSSFIPRKFQKLFAHQ